MIRLLSTYAAASMLCCGSAALATALPAPAATGQIWTDTGGHGVSGFGTYAGSSNTLVMQLEPAVISFSTANAHKPSVQPSGEITYWFSADGAPNAMVPVSIAYTLLTGASGYDSAAYAALYTALYDAAGNNVQRDMLACSSAGLSSCSGYGGWTGLANESGVLSGYVPSDTPVPINVLSMAFAYSDSNSYGFADPHITVLDPNFTLQLPNGVGNQTGILGSVPEPATWAMMLLGFAGVGIACRAKRKRVHLRELACA